jgi:hypothetical protein
MYNPIGGMHNLFLFNGLAPHFHVPAGAVPLRQPRDWTQIIPRVFTVNNLAIRKKFLTFAAQHGKHPAVVCMDPLKARYTEHVRKGKKSKKGGELVVHHCQFCNETIDHEDIHHNGGVIQIEDSWWHAECYAEYFGLDLDDALEEAGA